ncbi:MAG: PKD domain-containing protein [Flavobacteriales bacterium]|nr:PKD domain-containing protein [Flavobacteriales bacterium]
MDAFEKRIKDSLEEFEVPYNSADWTQLQRSLKGGSTNGRWGSVGLYLLLLSGGLAIGAGAYSLLQDEPIAGIGTERSLPVIDQVEVSPAVTAGRTSAAEVAVVPIGAQGDPAHHAASETAPHNTAHTDGPSAKSLATVVAKTSDDRSELVNTTNRPNDLAFRASATEGCPGTSIEFAVNSMPENAIYLWNFGDGSFSNQNDPDHTFAKSGKFEVMLSLSNTGGGNIQSKPSSDLIVIHEAPQATFTTMKMEYEGHIPSVHFENRSQGGQSYHWDFGDGTTSAIAHPDHVFLKKGVYPVELTVTNEKGCVDKQEREIRIDRDYNLDAPASFSPNGDGQDDLFMPDALRKLGVRFQLAVHDANTGRKVYETSDATKPWTGRVDNRTEACLAGDYVWMAQIKEGAHLGEVTFNGKVSLVR